MSELRKNILDESRRIVVKIGSRILVDSEKGGVRTRYIQKLADSVARLMEAGKEVVVVTSGAVGTGMSQLGYKEKPTVLAEKQACAAVGQIVASEDHVLRRRRDRGSVLRSEDIVH